MARRSVLPCASAPAGKGNGTVHSLNGAAAIPVVDGFWGAVRSDAAAATATVANDERQSGGAAVAGGDASGDGGGGSGLADVRAVEHSVVGCGSGASARGVRCAPTVTVCITGVCSPNEYMPAATE